MWGTWEACSSSSSTGASGRGPRLPRWPWRVLWALGAKMWPGEASPKKKERIFQQEFLDFSCFLGAPFSWQAKCLDFLGQITSSVCEGPAKHWAPESKHVEGFSTKGSLMAFLQDIIFVDPAERQPLDERSVTYYVSRSGLSPSLRRC